MSDIREKLGTVYRVVSGKPYNSGTGGLSNIYYQDCTREVEALIESAKREGAIEGLEWAEDKFDSLLQATEDGDRVNPGEYYEAIEDRIREMRQQLKAQQEEV